MEIIRVTGENLEREHICCAISNNRDIQVASKKEWMAGCFADGLTFLKSAQRGKCFIEYIPAEKAWAPVLADNYLYIDCFWVSGSLKGHGYANELLDACLQDAAAQGKNGLCVLSSDRKRPFLSDPKYLAYKGFSVADRSDVGINLLYRPLKTDAPAPRFTEAARHPRIGDEGFVLFYSHQCPFNAKYVPALEQIAAQNGIPFRAVRFTDREQARAAHTPYPTYSLFYNGRFLTHEQQNEKRFTELVKKVMDGEQSSGG